MVLALLCGPDDNSNATVVALGTQRLRNKNGSPHSETFIQEVLGNLTQPPSQWFDAFDWHPYRMGDTPEGPEAGPDPVRLEMQAMAAKYAGGKPMWNTEFGYKYASKSAEIVPPGPAPACNMSTTLLKQTYLHFPATLSTHCGYVC